NVRDAIRHTRAIASMNEATGAARAMCVMARCRRAMERTTSAASARQLESTRIRASEAHRLRPSCAWHGHVRSHRHASAASAVSVPQFPGAAISRCRNRQQSL
ncbi:hypothetical protein, partial [Burkholderia pseudomallei]|uniref:hypothetical protein n=1 Tax=Burkholderia pseudomallei TaxID=28450 RepID=UPI002116EAFA